MIECIEITNGMIDRAWRMARCLEDEFPRYAGPILDTLEVFHIYRCGGCEGGGLVPAWTKEELSYTNDLSRMHEEMDDCPDCAKWGSHGWVIGGEDEARHDQP
jgi:hypothetical protein